MASNIKYLNIDENFPVAGVDNPSDGFRNNFGTIKNSLGTAKTEIEALQSTTAKINSANNFAGNTISNANFLNVTQEAFNGGFKLETDTDIDFTKGQYQKYQIGKSLTLNLTNWPTNGKYASMKLGLRGDTTSLVTNVIEAEKCQRDIGYFIDGAAYDMALGTNYNAIFLGIAETNSVDLSQTVKDTIEASRAQIKEVPEVYGEAEIRIDAFYDELMDIIENGRGAANPISFPNPVGVSDSRKAIKDKLLANLSFIEAEINAWVEKNYGATANYTHDVSKCSRDVKYAIWSFCYDMLYGGNSATYYNARFFFYASANLAPGIASIHKQQTVAAYGRLKEIIGQIVLGQAVEVSRNYTVNGVVKPGNTLTQQGRTTAPFATTTDAAALSKLAELIGAVVNQGLGQLPDVSTVVKPSVSWATPELRFAKTAIDNAKTSIINAVAGTNICTVNFTVTNGSIRYDKGFPVDLKVSSANKLKFVEFWSDEGNTTIYAKYLGEFDINKYGVTESGNGFGNIAIDDLSDVSITGLAANQGLIYNGTEFVNADLDYNFLVNKPIIPTDLSGFTNEGTPTQPPYINDLGEHTTDELPQGLINKYLTAETFGAFFNEFNNNAISNIIDDVTTDSVETSATTPSVASGSTLLSGQFNQVVIPDVNDVVYINYFHVGQTVRLYGANLNNTNINTVPTISSITKNGFTGVTTGTLYYKIAQFDLYTGKISASSAATSIIGVDLTNFNNTNNITVNMLRSSTNYGILLYRSTDNTTYKLVSVLGPKELGADADCSFTDFYDYDVTEWSGKDITNNTFSSITHFPLTPPSTVQPGWIDTSIVDVDITNKRVTLAQPFYTSASNLIISHNDTIIIQSSIDSRAAQNLNSLRLGDKTYIISSLVIPPGFSIFGRSKRSRLKKLSWSGYNSITGEAYSNTKSYVKGTLVKYGAGSGAVYIALDTTLGNVPTDTTYWAKVTYSSFISNKMLRMTGEGSSLSIAELKIDGNMLNQFLLEDGTDSYANYAIHLLGPGHNLENVIITNPCGGGVAAEPPGGGLVPNQSATQLFNFVMNLCQIENSALTDRYAFSPLIASGGRQILVTNNVFTNFAEAVDVSVTDIGVFQGNIVSNCGSGVLIFASTKFISSPNVLLGPAGEYLPGPDILNSEFDSVNIVLEPNSPFISGSYVYHENGQEKDLTENGAFISYRIDKIRKNNNVEELYGQVLLDRTTKVYSAASVNSLSVRVDTAAAIGAETVQLKNTQANIDANINLLPKIKKGMLVKAGGTTLGYVINVTNPTTTVIISLSAPLEASLTINTALTIESNVSGARAITVESTSGISAGSGISGTNIPTGTTVKSIEGSALYIDQPLAGNLVDGATITAKVVPIFPIDTANAQQGEFLFTIPLAYVDVLTDTYSYTTLKAAVPTTNGVPQYEHIGLAYRAFLTQYVPSGRVVISSTSPRVLDNSTEVTYYQVEIDNPVNLSVFSKVKFKNHNNSTPDLNEIIGEIVRFEAVSTDATGKITRGRYTIKYDVDDITDVGDGGTLTNPAIITVENTFVLAKGRIL